MMIFDKQPIENATVYVYDDNGMQTLIIEPNTGFKLRSKGDNTYSTMKVGFSAQFKTLLDNYIAVSVDDPDEPIEIVEEVPTDEEVDDSIALEELKGVILNDENGT